MKSFVEYLEEDSATSDIKVKAWVDRTGVTRTRKVHPHIVDFKNSKSGGEPSQNDAPKR
ncbi:hypothetical protein UFOVP84_139 [uncultured Caudovirales phage]|uniref:Uncharacterized protein n=1 Tax=uncultured Caudovirales phage TaxID=2100421 RepID=A0A6J5L171_9CAUD|nr:hypothetical protein UFOVP84_139 [uncultured Caudovirales phage]